MRIGTSTWYVVGLSAAIAMVAGCSNGGSQLAPTAGSLNEPPGTSESLGRLIPLMGLGTSHTVKPVTTKSWARADAKINKLVYYSDSANGTVNFYSYLEGTPMGQIAGLNDPTGLCSDDFGDVWVANSGDSNLFEYPHGGTTAVGNLKDSGQVAIGCSVDPITGDIAVSNQDLRRRGGNVTIFKFPNRFTKVYHPNNIRLEYFLSYDDRGNLFVDGESATNNFRYDELPAGGTAFKSLTFPATIKVPGTVSWDNQKNGHMIVGDQVSPVLFQTQTVGSTVSITGTITLRGVSSVLQGTATQSKFIAPDSEGNALFIFAYPAGGNALVTIPGANTGGQPFGSALSEQKS